MHPEAHDGFVTAALRAGLDLNAHLSILDLGGQDVNGTVHAVFPNATFVTLDIEPGVGVDVVGDARTWTPTSLFDVVIATEVFEHVEGWEQIVGTAAKALDPSGWGTFVTTCASTNRPVHGATGAPLPAEGEYYQNVPADAMLDALNEFFHDADVTYRYPPGDAYGWARRPRQEPR
jgi:hypothetical protein